MKKGDVIYIEYVGRLENGEIFDLTDEELAEKEGVRSPRGRYGAVPVVIGEGFVIKGLEQALKAMKVGEEKEVVVPPERGFGKRDSKKIKLVTEKWLEKRNIPPTPGLVVDFGTVKGRIQSVSGGRVRIDFNNPLAGKRLKYKVTVVKRVKGDKNKIAAVTEYFTGKKPGVSISKGKATVDADLPPHLREVVSDLVMKITDIKKLNFKGKDKNTT